MAAVAAIDPDSHILEHTAKVYLELRGGQWALAASSVDGKPLDVLKSTVCNTDACRWCASRAGKQARADADMISLPTARELLDMLAAAHGLVARPEAELRELENVRRANAALYDALATTATDMSGVLERLARTVHGLRDAPAQQGNRHSPTRSPSESVQHRRHPVNHHTPSTSGTDSARTPPRRAGAPEHTSASGNAAQTSAHRGRAAEHECVYKCGDKAPGHAHFTVIVREADGGKLLGRLAGDGRTTHRKIHAAVLPRARADHRAKDIMARRRDLTATVRPF